VRRPTRLIKKSSLKNGDFFDMLFPIMDKTLSEKLYFGLIVTDYDYMATRHLMGAALFPSAAALANVVLDRYIKMVFQAAGRDDLVVKVRGWKGNESHNVPKILKLYNQEFTDVLSLSVAELTTLENIFKLYCFRYSDYMFQNKLSAGIVMRDMYTIDKVAYFFRSKIRLIPPHLGNTILDQLSLNNSCAHAAISVGNINLRDVLFSDNRYFVSVKASVSL